MDKKQIQNRDFYKNTGLYSKTANRITIPMEYLSHVKTAQFVFEQLSEALNGIMKDRIAGYRKVASARMEIYKAHRALIETADESWNNKYKDGKKVKGPLIDYKNVR